MEILNEIQKKEAKEKMINMCDKLSESGDMVDNYILNQMNKLFAVRPRKEGKGPESEYSCPLCHHSLYQYYNWSQDRYCEMCGQKIVGPKRVHGLRVRAFESI